MRIVITGGHHTSALPVIEELRKVESEVQIFWFGHKHTLLGDKNPTLEYKEITSLGIPFYDLKAGKVYKTFNIARLLRVPFGVFQALFLLTKIKPDVILSFGGYLAAPTVLAGWILNIPSLTHEQTVVVGYSNKFISKFVKKVLISWKESEKFFPPEKVVHVGLPLRKEVFEIGLNTFETENTLPLIYITAGKTGSHIINEVIKESLPELLSFCNIIHQCGDNSVYNDFDDLKSIYKEIKAVSKGKYFLRKFVLGGEIGNVFDKADLVISRSGAHTTCEILGLEKPCILIPIPWVSHNEQYRNAELLEKYGLAKILNQKSLSVQTLVMEIKDSLNKLDKYKLNNLDLKKLVMKDSSKLIVGEVYKISKQK